ncbi:MAG TPA: MEDS domain-containing protein [Burkholderiales bacterium]|nr:MEDS domain-containing protein [Burkholderiales bacterium]
MHASHWQETLKTPAAGDHIVQVYQDEAFLCEAVAHYVGAGLKAGEAAVIIARAEHLRLFGRALGASGAAPESAAAQGRLVLLDAAETLSRFMRNGAPQREAFDACVGSLIAGLRAKYAKVRAYGEMVDLLWQDGERDAALQLEELWNQLAHRQDFSLFCAYFMDPLDAGAYGGGALECVCRAHTHLIPARDYERFDEAVAKASEAVLDRPLSQMLLSVASMRPPKTRMPLGQATLLWLQKNMPLTAEKVLARARAYAAASPAAR